ncbi:hypothetical protein ACHAXM_010223 [Skeletonema potamos]|jgi:hypothetical protein
MSYGHPQRRGRQQQSPSQNALDYSDSDRTDFTPYSQGSYYFGGGNSGGVRYNDGGGTLEGSDRTPYSYYQDYEGGNTLDGSDRTPYTQYSYYENGNQLDYSDSDRTPYSQSQGQSYQSRALRDSFNSRVSTQPGRRHGSIDSGFYEHQHCDMQSVQSYGGDNMSQASSTIFSALRSQNGHAASVCGSTSSTTVANGGRGRCPYQIGFNVQNAGNQMSTSKRIIHFRFGFANAQALAQGKAGVDCRGQEHDLYITWSITGGKRMISMDGREIQYTAGKRTNPARRADILEAAWKMSNPDRVFELKCYAYAPKAGSPEKRNPLWKQYNLTIDGRSFFELPEIFDLGLKGLGTARLPSTISGRSDWDQMTAPSSKTGVPSSSVSTQYTDQSLVKNSIQSRIEEQRRLLNRKKQGSLTANKSRHKCASSDVTYDSASDLSSNLMSFRSLNVSDNQEDSGIFSSGVYSAEPSELREARNRQSAADEQANGRINGSKPQQQAQQPKIYQPKSLPAMSESSTNIVPHRMQNQYPPQQSNSQGQERTTQMTLVPQQPPTYEEITQALVPASFVPPQDANKRHSQQLNRPMNNQPQALPPPGNQPKTFLHHHTRASSSPQYQTQATNTNQRSAQYQTQPTNNNQRSAEPRPNSSSQYQTQPTNNNQRSAEHRADTSPQYQTQPTNNNQRGARGQPISIQHENILQQPIADNLPKGVNKFAFF